MIGVTQNVALSPFWEGGGFYKYFFRFMELLRTYKMVR